MSNKPECFGEEYGSQECGDCEARRSCEDYLIKQRKQKSKEGKTSNKPDCFGNEYDVIGCSDCKFTLECKKNFIDSRDDPSDPKGEFVKCLLAVRQSETVAERMALKIFEESIKHPLLLLADNIKAVYASRGDPIATASALAHSITKEIIDDLLGGD